MDETACSSAVDYLAKSRNQQHKFPSRMFLPFISALFLSFVVCGCSGGHPVNAAPVAPVVAISASPTSIAAGRSSTLSVTATNATQVTITGSDSSSYTLAASGGTQVITPKATTTYTATASGAGGKVTATATVTVTANAPPTVTVTALPASIAAGASSLLTVAAKNATQVAVAGSDGSSYNLQANGGTQSVSPAVTTTYTATATGAGGTITATATITVTPSPAPTVTMTANPTAIVAGGSAILTVMPTNATAVTISGTDNSSYTLPTTGGIQAVSPPATTIYTVTATGAGGTVTATATVTVTPNPVPTVTITATPSSIVAGNSSTLNVTAVNNSMLTLSGSDGTIYTPQSLNGGTQTVSPATTTSYTVSATGPGGTVTATAIVTVTQNPTPTVSITANPTSVILGNASTLTVAATNATQVTVAGSDGSSYSLVAAGATQAVSPVATTVYTATATGAGGTVTASTTLTVNPVGSLESINHVIFLLQENHSFDNYFGMLNPYRVANNWTKGDDGITYEVDGIDDKLTTITNQDDGNDAPFHLFKFKSTCIDDNSSAWLASYGDVNRYNFKSGRDILMDGFVHNAEGYARSCAGGTSCSGDFTDLTGHSAMGYYDQDFLNYYYYMASEFAVSDRWFSPVSSKSVDNRIATFTGGTTQGLVADPGGDDHLSQLAIPTIFQELDLARVSWKVYYTVTQGFCLSDDVCGTNSSAVYPATTFSNMSYSYRYMYENVKGEPCTPPTQASSVVGDTTNSFCIDPTHVAPISHYYDDLAGGSLPSFAFIEAGYGNNDEHPGSGQSILSGQTEVAKVVNAFMMSQSWKDSVFFLAYDEGGGPYDHVPPVPGSSSHFTNPAMGTIPDISSIAVNADSYIPCLPAGGIATTHCDLSPAQPGADPLDDAAVHGFAAQLGFRVPNFVISPFTRKHFVSHTPMDHTAILKFVENRFIGPSAHLTLRDAAQPDLLEFFNFSTIPWATPPTPPVPVTPTALGKDPCTPASVGP